MIIDTVVAEKVSELMLNISGQIDSSVALIRDSCSSAEFESYRRAAGRVMGEILFEILNPLYAEHPSLKPPGFE